MWMFGSRTTVQKVRNSLTWFSHGSGAILAPEPLERVPFSTTRVFETVFSWGWFRGTPFRSLLQGGLKSLGARGGRRSEDRRGLHLRKASRGLQGGLKGA